MSILQAESLRKVYHGARGRNVEAVRDASFSVGAGEIFGLLGPNGAGKTTLLRMLGTIITPTSGQCVIQGRPAAEDPHTARRQIGFLSGNTKLYGRLTVREMLRYFGRLYGLEDGRIRSRTEAVVAMLDMGPFVDRRCDTLSTGQTQRASIARVILHEPSILILDEPTLGLDILSSRTILDFIRRARDEGRSIIFSTHYMTEAEMLCDRIGLMHEGSILALGTLGELYERSGTANVHDAFMALVYRTAEVAE